VKLGAWRFLTTERIADGPLGPLLLRHIIVKGPLFGLCVHKLCRSDYDRALHDHPWWFISLVLWGGYLEVTAPDPGRDAFIERRGDATIRDPGLRFRGPMSLAFRPAEWRHRVVIPGRSGPDGPPRAALTLVLMGPRIRKWGFWVDGKWCWWRRHDPTKNICSDEVIHRGGGD